MWEGTSVPLSCVPSKLHPSGHHGQPRSHPAQHHSDYPPTKSMKKIPKGTQSLLLVYSIELGELLWKGNFLNF